MRRPIGLPTGEMTGETGGERERKGSGASGERPPSSGSGGAQAADGQLCYSWRRPLEARVLEKRELSSLSDRRVLHVAFGLEKDSDFEPGDLLSILPLQDPDDVARLCERLGHHTDAVVRLCPSRFPGR